MITLYHGGLETIEHPEIREPNRTLDFVMSNRKIVGFQHNYDVVVGPVANDKVYTAFALYESGTTSREVLKMELKTYRLVDQYLFHTDAAINFLKFQSSKRITR